MKKAFGIIALLSVLLCCPMVFAADNVELSIVTGQEQGTYYAMGRDLKKLAGRNGMDLSVIPSLGSLENLVRVYQFPSIQLGIVQLDTLAIAVLNAVAGKDETSGELTRLLERTQVVLPLYSEEVHIIGSQDIKDIADLQNKKVSIGLQASGTYGTAQVVLQQYKVGLAEVFTMDSEQAIAALRRGQIDAFFAVIGSPAEVFVKGITKDDKFHLVPITWREGASYKSTVIPANTYAWQTEAVPTLSVLNALITSDRNLKGGDCQNIGRFAKMVYENLGWLKENGHPKWKSVTLDKEFLAKDKVVSPCVSKAMSQAN